jgi:hypothetical protein
MFEIAEHNCCGPSQALQTTWRAWDLRAQQSAGHMSREHVHTSVTARPEQGRVETNTLGEPLRRTEGQKADWSTERPSGELDHEPKHPVLRQPLSHRV